jgi:YHS domain-containing protein
MKMEWMNYLLIDFKFFDRTLQTMCNHKKHLCGVIECPQVRERSFGGCHSDKVEYWLKRNEVSPYEVFKSSGNKYWFNCRKCEHTFDASLSGVNKGHFCPYCANQKLCDLDCQFCHESSFASYPLADCWSKRNLLNPRQVFKSSGNKYWFNCRKCQHEFDVRLNDVNNGRFCPLCVNKTEKKLFEILQLSYPTLIRNFRADWCKNPETNRHLPFDFLLPELNIIIELDGDQHFKQVSNWAPPEQTQARDKYKSDQALANNFSLIRLYQPDVLSDHNNWLNKLLQTIKEIITNNKEPNIYILY